MKLSELIANTFGSADLSTGKVDITPSMVPTTTPDTIGVRAAERIARLVGTVHLASYSVFRAPYGVGRLADSHHSGSAIAQFLSGAWRVSGDSTWRKYGSSTNVLFGGKSDVRVYADDVEINADISTEFVADANERAERVVWRPRPNQFVVSCMFDGRFSHTTVLMSNGTERTCFAPSSYNVILGIVGGCDSDDFRRRIQNDPVWGRSQYRGVRGETFSSYTRVVGFGAYRRILAASRADLATLTGRPGFAEMLMHVRATDVLYERSKIIARWLIVADVPRHYSPYGSTMQNAIWSAEHEYGARIRALADGTALGGAS